MSRSVGPVARPVGELVWKAGEEARTPPLPGGMGRPGPDPRRWQSGDRAGLPALASGTPGRLRMPSWLSLGSTVPVRPVGCRDRILALTANEACKHTSVNVADTGLKGWNPVWRLGNRSIVFFQELSPPNCPVFPWHRGWHANCLKEPSPCPGRIRSTSRPRRRCGGWVSPNKPRAGFPNQHLPLVFPRPRGDDPCKIP